MPSRRRRASNSPRKFRLGLVLAAAWILCSSSGSSSFSGMMRGAAAQQQGFMTVSLENVQTLAETRYNWQVKATADVKSIQVPVDSNTGWPQVRYKVSYTRSREAQTVYTLSGQVVLTSRDKASSAILLPNITVTTTEGRVFIMPESAIECPSLVVPAGRTLTCNFAASYAGRQPLPGTVSGQVSLAGVLIPISLEAPAVGYDFSAAETFETGAFGTASNYFEMGSGIMQPYGVYGEQPPPGMRLEDSREFNFIAVFGAVPSSKCGQQFKAVNTAELVPSSSDINIQSQTKTRGVTVAITLTGCDGPTGFSENPAAPGPVPVPQTPSAVLPPTPTPAPAPAPVPAVPGVSFAEAGSTLCGTGVCPAGQRCFDGWNCCPLETPVCGAQCCQAPSVCVSNKCVAPGSIPCGTTVCTGGLSCIQDVCCSADRVVCGGKCCDTGQSCILGVCAAAGSRQCGQGICDATQSCVDGVCCAMGETACGGRCCPAGNTCLQGQFCAPTGSTMCGNGQICNAPLQCAGGMLCCDAGASFCGGACCPATSQCQAGRCLAAGQTLCGTTVCGIGQTCQGGMVCCDTSATFCNNACCANGNTCVNNQCVPTGSVPCGTTVCPPNQICGNPSTGLCCQSLNQFGCGTACCNSFTDVCDQYRQICTPRFNTACVAGQIWCPGAQQCCPVGQLCSFNQCLPRNAIGRRRLHGLSLWPDDMQ